MRYPLHTPPIFRIGVRPDAPPDPAAVRTRCGPRQPHTDATHAAVRRLFEKTVLTYQQIAARTGVSLGSISNWAHDGEWKRPLFAPRSNDRVPTARTRAKVRRRLLAARLVALAERHIRELEESERVDADKLAEAHELLTIAKLAARRRRPKQRPDDPLPEQMSRPIMELCAAGVDFSRAPRAAVDDFLANREKPPKQAGSRWQSRRARREEHHAWMMEKE